MDSSGYGASLLALTIIGATALLLSGCAQNAPYHTEAGARDNCRGERTDEGCTQAYYQEHDGYDLAFVEFSERGNAFDDAYVENVLDRIQEKASQDGVVLVTFVHGWKHNANEHDPNVLDFTKTLEALGKELTSAYGSNALLAKRQLIGLYIGWRGASLKVPGLDDATFWDRKAVAGEVGKGGVTTVLLELNRIFEDNAVKGVPDPNVFVVVGHSFGGAIVVSALNEVLSERVIKRHRKHDSARSLLDGVIVINPAIEATQMLPLVEAAARQPHYDSKQRPLFVSLSSDADWATHYAFPAGQTLGLLTWKQADLERGYLHDREQPTQRLPLREKHLDATAVGNFAPFLTHRLTSQGQGDSVGFSFQTCSADPPGCAPKGWTSLSGQPYIDFPQNYPLYFIKTDETVITEHNDIFNPKVRAFLVTVIDDVVREKLTRAKGRRDAELSPRSSILSRPNELVQRMRRTYDETVRESKP